MKAFINLLVWSLEIWYVASPNIYILNVDALDEKP